MNEKQAIDNLLILRSLISLEMDRVREQVWQKEELFLAMIDKQIALINGEVEQMLVNVAKGDK